MKIRFRFPGIFFFFLLFCVFYLTGCGSSPSGDKKLLVFIEENEHIVISNNGMTVGPGRNARFTIQTENGYEITDADYAGEYRIWKDGKNTILELKSINYPTRISLTLSCSFRRITYDANGGIAENDAASPFTETYDITTHLRPNTSIGTDVFSREGYTLVSWNTAADGSGTRVGLGSRVTVEESGLTLYAQWMKWSPAEDFSYEITDSGLRITDYLSSDLTVVIPEEINGFPVTAIAAGAFAEHPEIETVVISPSVKTIEANAFAFCGLSKLTLYDNIESLSDAAFFGCSALSTLYINAVEAPYGYEYRRESMYADKIDLLITAAGETKMVFYAGCSMWYNLDSESIRNAFGSEYRIINLGLNGTVSSRIQMEILTPFMEEGDLFIHTPEVSSIQQLMEYTDMGEQDHMLWAGIENNYDLFALVDIRGIEGVFDTLNAYLERKDTETTYADQHFNAEGEPYLGVLGGIGFVREETKGSLSDDVILDPVSLLSTPHDALKESYSRLIEKGVRVYVSCAVVNIDAVAEEEKENLTAVNEAFHTIITEMAGPTPISNLWDFVYHDADFYDTNYHLLSEPAVKNTAVWIRDIRAQLAKDQTEEAH